MVKSRGTDMVQSHRRQTNEYKEVINVSCVMVVGKEYITKSIDYARKIYKIWFERINLSYYLSLNKFEVE